jgi:uncharacterized DUF497 family protein
MKWRERYLIVKRLLLLTGYRKVKTNRHDLQKSMRAGQAQGRREPFTVYTTVVYTEVVLNNLQGFDWDAANVGHILRPAVSPIEVEEATGGPHLIIPAKIIKGEKRWKLFGKAVSGRYLVVVFTIRRKRFRTVTAYEMNAIERRNYAPQID